MRSAFPEDGRSRATRSTVPASIEDVFEVRDGPFAIDVLGVRGVDDFEAVVEGAGGGPHFAEHGVVV